MSKVRLAIGLARALMPEPMTRLSYAGRLPEVDGRRIDPKAQAVSELAALLRDPNVLPTVEESRAALETLAAKFDLPCPAGVEISEMTLPGAEGERPARSYTPPGWTDADATCLFLHGGGWIQGSLTTHHGLCGRLAVQSGVRVISYDYRLAPEHKYPAANEDALAAFLALCDGALGCAADRLAVAGDSAGGNLTAGLMHDLVVNGHPRPRAQMLIYPAVDGTMSSASMEALRSQPLLSRLRIDWYLDLYLPEGTDRTTPRFSPLFSDTLHGHPPTLIVAAGHDPLWDDAHAYAGSLSDAGVAVETIDYPGQVHAFLSLTRVLPQGIEATTRVADWLKEVMS